MRAGPDRAAARASSAPAANTWSAARPTPSSCFFAIVLALDLVGVYVGWILNALVGVVIALVASVGIALSIGSVGFVQDLMTMRRFPELIRPGTRIRVGNIRGRVIEVTETSVIVEGTDGVIHVPGRYLATRPLLVEPDKAP